MAVLEVRDLRKSYGATVALNGATLSCEENTVHGIIGENGAGKSTFMKILSGLTKSDGGMVMLDGRPIANLGVRESLGAGIATAHQELSLVPSLTVAENLLGGAYNKPGLSRGLRLRPRALHRYASEQLEAFGVTWLRTDMLVQDLDLASQQSLEIVKALVREPRLLALDEPTSALNAVQVRWLMDQIDSVQRRGGTIIYVSHRLGEIRSVCKTVSVFREGRNVAVVDPQEVDDEEMFSLIAGERRSKVAERAAHATSIHDLAGSRPDGPAVSSTTSAQAVPGEARSNPLLRVSGMVTSRSAHGISLEAYPGQIIGLAGLQGQGQREFFLTLYGVAKARAGTVQVDGKTVAIHSPRDAIRAGIGLALVPEDRKTEGVLLDLGVTTNLTLPILARVSHAGFVTERRERSLAREVAKSINLSPTALSKRVGELSGGNQQKIALGKWLLARSRILLLHDPTRGVDIGTKEEIFSLVRGYLEEGGAVLFYSSDLDELMMLPDEVLVFYDGAIIDKVPKHEIEAERLVSSMLGRKVGSRDG